MKKLTLSPSHNIFWNCNLAWYDNIFTDPEINSIVSYGDSLELERSKTEGKQKDNYRSGKFKMFGPDASNKWIFDRLIQAMTNLNERDFQLDLWGFDHVQYTVYNEGDQYNTHSDIVFGHARSLTRKLSCSLILNDASEYTGGEFDIIESADPTPVEQKKGRLIVFPSYQLHRVRPVLSGIRKSLVIWVVGPPFK
jgi:PKHD-type hydroxylase